MKWTPEQRARAAETRRANIEARERAIQQAQSDLVAARERCEELNRKLVAANEIIEHHARNGGIALNFERVDTAESRETVYTDAALMAAQFARAIHAVCMGDKARMSALWDLIRANVAFLASGDKNASQPTIEAYQ